MLQFPTYKERGPFLSSRFLRLSSQPATFLWLFSFRGMELSRESLSLLVPPRGRTFSFSRMLSIFFFLASKTKTSLFFVPKACCQVIIGSPPQSFSTTLFFMRDSFRLVPRTSRPLLFLAPFFPRWNALWIFSFHKVSASLSFLPSRFPFRGRDGSPPFRAFLLSFPPPDFPY